MDQVFHIFKGVKMSQLAEPRRVGTANCEINMAGKSPWPSHGGSKALEHHRYGRCFMKVFKPLLEMFHSYIYE